MIRVAYKVVIPKFNEYPEIVKVDITDQEGLSWVQAKSKCRAMILEEAAALRSLTEKTYFQEYQGGN